jgi:hypothetical protein
MRCKQPPSRTDPRPAGAVPVQLGSSLALTRWVDSADWTLGFIGWRLGFTVVCDYPGCQPAGLRRRRRVAATRDGWESEPGWFDARQAALIGLAVVVCHLAIWLGRAPTIPQGVEGSLLWLLPSEGTDPQAVRLGVLSQEFDTGYRLVVQSGGNQLANWDSISLQPGKPGIRYSIFPRTFLPVRPWRLSLYLSDQPDAYRTVRLDRSASP